MSASALEGIPEYLGWDELQRLPEDVAAEIELWDRRVIRNPRGPLEHQRFAVRMRNALESNVRAAVQGSAAWQVEVATDVFFKEDKSSFLTPGFLIRRCLPSGADTTAADVILVGEVLAGSDGYRRPEWKKDRYAEAGIPWYWELELDVGGSWDVTEVRAYMLAQIPTADLAVKPLRSVAYLLVGEWEPTGLPITFPEPFAMDISWEDLAF